MPAVMSNKNNNPPRFRTREGCCLSALCEYFWVYEPTRQLPSDRPKSVGIHPHDFFQFPSVPGLSETVRNYAGELPPPHRA